jgi:uncharacterized protein YjeT (DUF2065 family)
MKWFLYTISILSIAAGCCTILYTVETNKITKSIVKGMNLKILSILQLIAGILFLLSATVCRYPWIIRFFGLMCLIEGVIAFTNPNKLYDRLLDWYFDSLSDQTHRVFGIIAIVFGTAIISWII